MLRSNLFVLAGRLAGRLPQVRGKNRAFLALYHALGLRQKHLHVVAKLRRPVQYRARLDLHSWLQRLAFVAGGYESMTVRLLQRLREHSPGYLLDVGANIGLISVPFALLEQANVYSVEAVPANVDALRENIDLNNLGSRVTVVPLALGDEPGTAEIQIEGDLHDGEGTGTANILATGSDYQCVRVPIRVSTLDTLSDTGCLPRGCGVIKIDTDGYDLKVLQGGRKFIAAERPVIFGEFAAPCLAWHGQGAADVVEFAKSNGYECWSATQGLRFTRTIDPAVFIQDMLLVPNEKISRLTWCLEQ